MAAILVLGAGVMGSALTVPAADNGNKVRLVGTHLDRGIIAALKRRGGIHPKLARPLPDAVQPLDIDELTRQHFAEADVVIVGVSSPGIDWTSARLSEMLKAPRPVAFVTKGLVASQESVRTYAETIPETVTAIPRDLFIGIGGPCIARELASRQPTASVYACSDMAKAHEVAGLMRTGYYRLEASDDITGVEACAALKNFFAIGVSAMQTRYADQDGGQAKNPTAAAFNQAVREMTLIARHIGGRRDTAFDLAGIGDLHVTVGGGRNSRLGHGLGRGRTVSQVMGGELAGETVEGIDTARALAAWLKGHMFDGRPILAELPLARCIIDAVLDDAPFSFDFGLIGSS